MTANVNTPSRPKRRSWPPLPTTLAVPNRPNPSTPLPRPIKVLRLVVATFFVVFYIGSLAIFMVAVSCQWFNPNHLLKFHLRSFPEVGGCGEAQARRSGAGTHGIQVEWGLGRLWQCSPFQPHQCMLLKGAPLPGNANFGTPRGTPR